MTDTNRIASIDLTGPFLTPPTSDRLLVICYGGLLDGLGLGLVFRGRGTTGGTDVIARITHRFHRATPGSASALGADARKC